MKSKLYGIKLDSLATGIEVTRKDLGFLCSLVEIPDENYPIPDAIEYAYAIVALSSQLEYMIEELSGNELCEEGEMVKLTKVQLMTLTKLADAVEEALRRLRECGISLKQN